MESLTEHMTHRGMQSVRCGLFAYEGPNGELIRQTDTRIDVWGRGDGNGHYDHYYYNGPNDYGKAPDNRHE